MKPQALVRAVAALMLLPITTHAATPCVADFTDFVARFEKDTVFQRQNTLYPLDYSYVDGTSQPAPRTVKLSLSRAQAAKRTEIEFPTAEQQKSTPLLRGQLCGNPNGCVVSFDKPGDANYSLRFSFGLRRGCWRLVGVASVSP